MAGKKVSFKTKNGRVVSFAPKGKKGKRKTGAGATVPAKRPRRAAPSVGVGAAPGAAPVVVGAGRRGSKRHGGGSKRSRAAKKAAHTRMLNHERRSRAAKKAARTRERHAGHRRQGAGSFASAGAGSTHAQRSRAAKKAARTRHHNAAHGKSASELRLKRLRRGKNGRFGSTGRPKQHPPMPTKRQVLKYLRHHGGYDQVAARENPIAPLDYLAAVAGGVFGLGVAYVVDDYIATSPVTVTGSGTTATATESPKQGHTFNMSAVDVPLWATYGGSVPWRLVAAGGLIFAPWALSFIPLPDAVKTGLRVVSLGAGLRTGGKLALDAGAKFLGNTALGVRLFQPQIAAQAAYAAVLQLNSAKPPQQLAPNQTTGTLNSVVTYPGSNVENVPVGTGHVGVGRQLAGRRAGASGCCANCASGLPCAAQVPSTDDDDSATFASTSDPSTSDPTAAGASGARQAPLAHSALTAAAPNAGPPAHRPGQNGIAKRDPYAGHWQNLEG